MVDKSHGAITAVDMKLGLPVEVKLAPSVVLGSIKDSITLIVAELRRVLDSVPPDLATDVLTSGIYLTGGGSLLKGLAQLITDQTNIPVQYVENPLQSVVLGCGTILDDLKSWKFVLESMPDEIRGSS